MNYNPNNGYVWITLWDGYVSWNTVALDEFRQRLMPCTAGLHTSIIDTETRITTAQVAELHNVGGWEICSHGADGNDPTAMDDETLTAWFVDAKNWLTSNGYTVGARIFASPNDSIDQTVHDKAVIYHSVIASSTEFAERPSGPTYDKQTAHDAQDWDTVVKPQLDLLLGDPGRCLRIGLHKFVESGPTGTQCSRARLQQILDYILDNKINPVTMSMLLDGERPTRRIFADGFDTGDIARWDDSVATPTVATAAKFIGTHGLSINANSELVRENLDAVTRYRFGFYINPNSLSMSEGAKFRIANLRIAGTAVAHVSLNYDSGAYKIDLAIQDDNSDWQASSLYTITDDWHWIEVDFKFAEAGHAELWINGVSQEKLEDIDCDTRSVNNIFFGRYQTSGTVTGAFFLDHFISDALNYIGPTQRGRGGGLRGLSRSWKE